MIDNLIKLKDFVPFFQSCIWIIFIIAIIIIFIKQIKYIINLVMKRIEHGSSIKAGLFEIGQDLKELEYAKQDSQNSIKIGSKGDEREEHRKEIYEKQKGIFISHIISPSTKSDQKYDVYIYLIRHKSNNFDDIEKAEFFFGHMWGNKVFSEKQNNGKIGISTSAYAPFLCTCCIRFKDGSEIQLNRYIDFEMSRLFNI